MSIDRRIVDMKFDNSQFESGVKETMSTLEKLKQSLNMGGAVKSIAGVSGAFNKMDMSGAADGISTLEQRFSTLGIMGMEVIRRITSGAIDMGKKLSNAIVGPILEGGRKRALNLEHAHFMFEGLGMDVEKAMASAEYAVMGTAFGLDEAAMLASQLGASGVEAGEDMSRALLATSGLAAMTGSSYADMGRIMGTVAGQNRLMTMQLRQLEARGLSPAATMAEQWGTTEQAVREMVTAGKVDFEMFAKSMEKAFGPQALKANETYTGALGNMKAALGRIGADFYIPHLEQQRLLFLSLRAAIDQVRKVLSPFTAKLIEFKGVMNDKLIAVIDKITAAMGRFTEKQKDGRHNLGPITILLKGFAAVFSLLAGPIQLVGRMLEYFFYKLQPIEVPLKRLSTVIGRFGTQVAEAVKGSETFKNVGDTLVQWAGKFADALVWLVTKFEEFVTPLIQAITPVHNLKKGTDDANKSLTPFGKLVEGLGSILSTTIEWVKKLTKSFNPLRIIIDIISGGVELLGKLLSNFLPFLRGVADTLKKAFSNLNFEGAGDILNVGVFTLFAIGIQRVVSNVKGYLDAFKGMFEGFFGSGSIFGSIKGILGDLGGALGSLQREADAGTLIKIAGAVGVLVVSLMLLSTIDQDALARGIVALSTVLAELMAGMKIMTIITKDKKGMKGIVKLAGAMVLLSAALFVMAGAIKKMSELQWDELARGLVGIAGAMAIMVVGVRLLDDFKFKGGVGMILLAGALHVMAGAVKKFGELDIPTLVKGLGAVGVVLLEIALFTKLMGKPEKMVSTGAAMVILSVALKGFATVVERFGSMNLSQLAIGLGGMAGALVAVALGMKLMPKGMMAQSVALIAVGAALKMVADVVKTFGELPLATLAKGMTSMFIALGGLATAMYFMSGTLSGSAALLLMSVALKAILWPIKSFAEMDFMTLVKGLGSLALVLGVFGAAGYLLAPVAPALLLLALAMSIFTNTTIAMGAAMITQAAGMTAMAAASVAKAKLFNEAFKIMLQIVPIFFRALADGIASFVVGIAENSAVIVAAVVKLLGKLLEGLLGFLDTIKKYMPKIVASTIGIVTAFMDTLAENLPKLIESGVNLLIALVNGIANGLRDNQEALRSAGKNLISAIVEAAFGVVKDIWDVGVKLVGDFIGGIKSKFKSLFGAGKDSGEKAKEGAKNVKGWKSVGANMMSSLGAGISSMAKSIGTAAKNVASGAVSGVKKFLGIASPSKVMTALGENTGGSFGAGIGSMAKSVGKSATGVARTAMDSMKSAISKVSDIIDGDLDLDPVITPILDMSNIDGKLDNLNTDATLNTARSAIQAQELSHSVREAKYRERSAGTQVNQGASINIEKLEVREEHDIELIAQRLHSLTLRKGRA